MCRLKNRRIAWQNNPCNAALFHFIISIFLMSDVRVGDKNFYLFVLRTKADVGDMIPAASASLFIINMSEYQVSTRRPQTQR